MLFKVGHNQEAVMFFQLNCWQRKPYFNKNDAKNALHMTVVKKNCKSQ